MMKLFMKTRQHLIKDFFCVHSRNLHHDNVCALRNDEFHNEYYDVIAILIAKSNLTIKFISLSTNRYYVPHDVKIFLEQYNLRIHEPQHDIITEYRCIETFATHDVQILSTIQKVKLFTNMMHVKFIIC
jgi:hypothetical protein